MKTSQLIVGRLRMVIKQSIQFMLFQRCLLDIQRISSFSFIPAAVVLGLPVPSLEAHLS